MVTAAGVVCILFAMFIVIRQVRDGHNLEAQISRNFLVDEAESKYPACRSPTPSTCSTANTATS